MNNSLKDRKFIIWDYDKNGHPSCNEDFEISQNGIDIIADGIVGRISIENAYLSIYPKWITKHFNIDFPNGKIIKPIDLKVGESCSGIWSLNNSKCKYHVYRVK